MEAFFLKLLNMSMAASWLIIAVIILRLVLKGAPRYVCLLLWALVSVRLILPFAAESKFSLIPSAEVIPEEIITEKTFNIDSGIDIVDSEVNEYLDSHWYEGVTVPDQSGTNTVKIMSVIWLAGIAAAAIYTLMSCRRIYCTVRESVPDGEDGVRLCDRIDTPFIFGILHPRIYLPSDIGEDDKKYVIAHEKAHLRRMDHIWKPLGFLLLCVYWFDPLVWAAYILFCRDLEFACDEKVIRNMGADIKKPYSAALVNCSSPRRISSACPLAFAETEIKGRIRSVLNYKKPAVWLVALSVITCIAVSVCFLTDPVSEPVLDMKLCSFIDDAIIEHSKSPHSDGNFVCADFRVLGTEETDDKITVYMLAMYGEYSYKDQLKCETALHMPTVITVKGTGGDYELTEYWVPGDGTEYQKDIDKKFPLRLRRSVYSGMNRYAAAQQEALVNKARDHFIYMEEIPVRSIETLRAEYPELFELSADKGLTVYVAKLGDGAGYRCTLREASETGPQADMSFDSFVNIREAARILSWYRVSPERVSAVPFQPFYSSYFWQEPQREMEVIMYMLGLTEEIY